MNATLASWLFLAALVVIAVVGGTISGETTFLGTDACGNGPARWDCE